MPKEKKTLLDFWEDQMRQSHTSSNYFFRKSPSHYHMMLLVMSAYKEGKKLSQAMRIMGFMKNDYHIDEDLFEIFVTSGVYKKYANDHVAESQIDEVDEDSVLGKK